MISAGATIRLLIDDPQPGVRNMAVDEALMRSAVETGAVTLRFYGWEPGCLSFGRNQHARGAYDPAAVAESGFDVVRRPTGGRSVLHHHELTYAVAAPADMWGSLRETYCRINRALASGLRDIGVAAECTADGMAESAMRARAPRPTARACFRDPLPGEVAVRGRKLVGSAQWRNAGAFLQHGSLLLVDEQHVVGSLRAPADGAPIDPEEQTGAISLAELLPELPARGELATRLARAFERLFDMQVVESRLTAVESSAAAGLEERYADPAWTWRR